jgi:hypothetical protein
MIRYLTKDEVRVFMDDDFNNWNAITMNLFEGEKKFGQLVQKLQIKKD